MFRRQRPAPVEPVEPVAENEQEKQNPESTTVEEKTPSNDLPPVSFFRLFRFATKREILLNYLGIVCAIAAGSAQVRISNPLAYNLTNVPSSLS
jgi:ATP-binding cassette subfamily B (MDR/TAP) protein 1